MAASWDGRLLSRARALELAGDWPIRLEADAGNVWWRVRLRCDRCGGSCGDFTDRHTSPDDVLAAVLRHAVVAHDLVLSGANRNA